MPRLTRPSKEDVSALCARLKDYRPSDIWWKLRNLSLHPYKGSLMRKCRSCDVSRELEANYDAVHLGAPWPADGFAYIGDVKAAHIPFAHRCRVCARAERLRVYANREMMGAHIYIQASEIVARVTTCAVCVRPLDGSRWKVFFYDGETLAPGAYCEFCWPAFYEANAWDTVTRNSMKRVCVNAPTSVTSH